jgi:hypothetical protein
MKLRSSQVPLVVAAAVLAAGYAAACGSSSDEPPAISAPTAGKQPPAPASGAGPGDGPGYVFAIRKLYLGDSDRHGVKSSTAWMQYGYDIDGRVSTRESTDLCQPAADAAPSKIYPDGDGGVDNSFGKNVWPTFMQLTPTVATDINQSITNGRFTVILDVEGLGNAADYAPSLLTRLYSGAELSSPPAWDGSDVWPVLPGLLENPSDITSTTVKFPTSYVVGNTWVSGSRGRVTMILNLGAASLTMNVEQAVITMDLAPDRTHGATGGIIAGVLETDVFVEQVRQMAGSLNTDLCDPTAFEGIGKLIRQASDIMKDSTQDPTRACDGISIGLGFDMTPIILGDVAPEPQPGADPCKCGNGQLDPGELCDGNLLDGQSCTSIGQGFTGGSLACDPTCLLLDVSGCTGGAGGAGGGGASGGGGAGGG